MDCPVCGFTAKSRAGLASHARARHPQTGTNAEAIAETLAELVRMGRVEAVDTARVQMVRSMAAALDVDPGNAALWRQYREAIGELTADGDDDDGTKAIIAEFERMSPSVRDA